MIRNMILKLLFISFRPVVVLDVDLAWIVIFIAPALESGSVLVVFCQTQFVSLSVLKLLVVPAASASAVAVDAVDRLLLRVIVKIAVGFALLSLHCGHAAEGPA